MINSLTLKQERNFIYETAQFAEKSNPYAVSAFKQIRSCGIKKLNISLQASVATVGTDHIRLSRPGTKKNRPDEGL